MNYASSTWEKRRFPIFAYVDPFHPSLTPGGFSLDTGGNTPLGVADFYELIGTPQQLAQFEEIQWMERNIILSNAMSTVCWIAGDEKLLSQYNQEKTKVLDKKQSQLKRLIERNLPFVSCKVT